jgi:hypothetical protein
MYCSVYLISSLLIILLQVWSVARKYSFNPPKVCFHRLIKITHHCHPLSQITIRPLPGTSTLSVPGPWPSRSAVIFLVCDHDPILRRGLKPKGLLVPASALASSVRRLQAEATMMCGTMFAGNPYVFYSRSVAESLRRNLL